MCCIIHRPKDAGEISEYKIKAITEVNSDGWGLSYFKDNKLEVKKSLKMDEALPLIRELEKENIEFLFHARFATHGDKILENCHPYNINNGLLFHNGKINIKQNNKRFSDTFYFALKVNKLLRKKKSIDLIVKKCSSIIGPSRLAFMTDDGNISKFGNWHELDGCHYSKLNWKWEYGYSFCGDYGYYSSRSSKPYSPPPREPKQSALNFEDPFLSILKDIEQGFGIMPHKLKRCNERDLIRLAIHFPEKCVKSMFNITL